MNEQAAIDRILETENLTDSLEDDDANWLINWGIERVRPLIAGIEDDEVAGEKVNQLMAVMRRLNQIAADRVVKSLEDLLADVTAFFSAYVEAFGRATTLNSGETVLVSAAIKAISPLEAIRLLIASAEPQAIPKPQENQAPQESEDSGQPQQPLNPRGPQITQD